MSDKHFDHPWMFFLMSYTRMQSRPFSMGASEKQNFGT